MKIVADENIPLLNEFFGEFGHLLTLPGRQINKESIKGADALIVRSVTAVNERLLESTSLKFVGSCTIGIDHVDLPYLEKQQIGFASAPGCNANSVVEYVLSCLSVLTETHGLDLNRATVGIVGFGHIGSLLGKRLGKLGIDFKAYDPFLDPESHDALADLDTVLEADVISLHVPLTRDGEFPSYHLLDKGKISSLSSRQVVINTSRGGALDEDALLGSLNDRNGPLSIIDAWEREPEVNVALAKKVFLGTPHIAGYSMDGKAKGTEQVYRAFCEYVGLPARHRAEQFMEEAPLAKMAFTSNAEPNWCLHTAIRACYDVRHDASLFRQSLLMDAGKRAEEFDRLRKDYRCRREFSGTRIQLKKQESELHRQFKALGFNLKQ